MVLLVETWNHLSPQYLAEEIKHHITAIVLLINVPRELQFTSPVTDFGQNKFYLSKGNLGEIWLLNQDNLHNQRFSFICLPVIINTQFVIQTDGQTDRTIL